MVAEESIKRPRVILVPFPAQGHVTPILHLARSLHGLGFDVIIATPDFIYRRLVARIDPNDQIQFASIPGGLAADDDTPKNFAAIDRSMENHMPEQLEHLLRCSDGLSCVVVDLLASWALPVAERCGVPVVGFWPAMLATYRLISAIPELIRGGFISEVGTPICHQSLYHHEDSQDQQVIEQHLVLPAQANLSTKELPWMVGNIATQISRFKFWLRALERAKSLQWLLVNSFPGEGGELDEHTIKKPSCHGPQVFLIGPLQANINANGIEQQFNSFKCNLSMWDEDQSCLDWLNKHSANTVIYVSFGSWVAPIAEEKITELALALEMTRRPFLWVLRDDESWRAGLPDGFLDRVVNHAKVVSWAPQEKVLMHKAIGCYLTHCGWNSTLEAIQHGKSLLCYPVSGDQFVNCAYIVKVWRIGIKPDGTSRSAIEDSIRRIMVTNEGEKIQERVMELKKTVMGNTEAVDNLHCFIDTVKRACKSANARI